MSSSLVKKNKNNIYKDYNINIDKYYIRTDELSKYNSHIIHLQSDKENNLVIPVLYNNKMRGFKTFLTIPLHVKRDYSQHIKKLLSCNKDKEAIELYQKELEYTNQFLYPIFSTHIKISKFKEYNFLNIELEPFSIDMLYERILIEQQLNNF